MDAKRKFYVLLLSLSLAIGTATAQTSTIDTTSSWDGSSSVIYWGLPNTATYGQVITAPSTTGLTDFTFYLKNNSSSSDPTLYRAYVYKWDDTNSKTTGSAIYSSSVLTAPTSTTAFTPIKISTGGVLLSSGTKYVLFFSTSDVAQSGASSAFHFGGLSTRPYSGGRFVFNNNGTTFSDLSTTSWSLWTIENLAFIADFGPYISASNTLAAVQQNASGLAATFNTNAAALQTGLTYDCNTFDENGLCASVGGRMTYAGSGPFGNQQAGLVIVSHKPSPYFRFGGFADQSVATATPSGIKQSNSGPMYGFFGYWNNQKDGMGLGASVTTSFSNNNLTISRSNALAYTEAGSGTTQMSGQGIQGQVTYALQATDRIKAIPYLGVRYYRVATGAYTEGSSADVTSPLSYNAMSQEVFAAVGGVGTSVFLAEKLTGTASVGIQQNMNYKMGNYQGTSSISGLSNFSVQMPSNTNSMATATAGLNYAIKKNEKLGVNVLWQQQAFTATNTVTALATYSIGF